MLLFAVKTDWSSLVWFVCLSGLFCLSLISRLYSAGNYWHRLSGVRSKLVNQLSRVVTFQMSRQKISARVYN